MALADGLAFILTVDGTGAGLQDLNVAVVVRLSGAADAAAGACHDLNHVVIQFARTELVHKVAGIAKGMGNANLQGKAVKVYGCLLDAVKAADIRKLKPREGLPCVHLIHGTEGCLHHAAGCSKDGTGT